MNSIMLARLLEKKPHLGADYFLGHMSQPCSARPVDEQHAAARILEGDSVRSALDQRQEQTFVCASETVSGK